jgi:hypothetical protein
MEIILLLLAFGFGYFVGCMRQGHRLLQNIFGDPDNMIRLLENYKKAQAQVADDAAKLDITEVTAENRDGIHFLYTKTTNEFLGQGPSLEQALENLRARYPNKTFSMTATESALDLSK